jgi:Putative HNHc nuclease
VQPVRSSAHLAFIRTLPCVCCGRTRGVQAAHVGSRGMGQKCSDLETIPLCDFHHKEQHRIGLKDFVRMYDLDIPGLIVMFTRKPYVSTLKRMLYGFSWQAYVANYGSEFIELAPVSDGLCRSVRILKDRVREILTGEILQRVKERAA